MQRHAVKGNAFRGVVPDRRQPIGSHCCLRGPLPLLEHNWHWVGNANPLVLGLSANNFRESLLKKRGKHGAESARAPIVALLRGQFRKSVRKVILHTLVNLADGRSLLDEPEHVNGQHLLVGKVGIGIVALPLRDCGEPSPVAATDAQVDPNERRGSVHVAKGGLVEMLDTSAFKPPAPTWFFNS